MIGPRAVFRLLLLTFVAQAAWSGQIRERRVYTAGSPRERRVYTAGSPREQRVYTAGSPRERRVYSAGFDAAYGASHDSHALHDYQGKDCVEPASIDNAKKKCLMSGCRVWCNTGYQTSSGAGSTQLYCDQTTGNYTLNGQPWNASLPLCRPYCGEGGCQNGGQCLNPGVCQCGQGFQGDQCQERKTSSCLVPDLALKDGHLSGTNTRLQVTCNPGFALPSGGRVATVECRAGAWHPPFLQQLQCVPQHTGECRPACLNGGTCLPKGVCQCPRGFWGPQCQVQRCVFPTRGLNHTSLAGTLRRLKVECHAGYQMASGLLLQVMVCQEGQWRLLPDGVLLQNHDLNCYPVCEPGCGEGERCTAPNHCSYLGNSHCQG